LKDFNRNPAKIKVVTQTGYSSPATVAARLYGEVLRGTRLEDVPFLPKSGWYPVGTLGYQIAASTTPS